MRLTVAQALVRYLAAQFAERDGRRVRLVRGVFGIFGHGNLPGLGKPSCAIGNWTYPSIASRMSRPWFTPL